MREWVDPGVLVLDPPPSESPSPPMLLPRSLQRLPVAKPPLEETDEPRPTEGVGRKAICCLTAPMSSGVKTDVSSSSVPSSTPTPRNAGDMSTFKTSEDAVSVAGVKEVELGNDVEKLFDDDDDDDDEDDDECRIDFTEVSSTFPMD